MTRTAFTLPVNGADGTAEPRLTREDVWAGLVAKAADPLPYIPAITECTVLSSGPQGLVREIVLGGDRFVEDIVFDTGRRVAFHRSDDRAVWTITNDIDEDERGGLLLTFSGEYAEEFGPDEAERREATMAEAVAHTLDVIRRAKAA
ncbi:SRPBCC family protein [Streptomyces sp. NPDC032472]|uniref:SRPBCC family protein n=1 Tax=Streptomyces sp. NPDC032472 TaxID=3155018 RepID=UPI0033CE61FE